MMIQYDRPEKPKPCPPLRSRSRSVGAWSWLLLSGLVWLACAEAETTSKQTDRVDAAISEHELEPLALAPGELLPGGPMSPDDKLRLHYTTEVLPTSSAMSSGVDPVRIVTEEGTLQKLVVYSPTYEIDQIYPSMLGPRASLRVPLGDPNGPEELLWIKSIHTEVVDELGEATSQEFMCHLVAEIDDPDARNRALGVSTPGISFATLSQGTFHKSFPEGFGLPVRTHDQLRIFSQVLNLNRSDVDVRVRHRIIVHFIRDADLRVAMKPMTTALAQTMVLVNGEEGEGFFGVSESSDEDHGTSCAVGTKAPSKLDVANDGHRQFAPHWILPEGRSVNHTLVTHLMELRHDTKIHSIDVHLHSYAEWVELRDLTEDRALFRSHAEQVAGGAGLAKVESYVSSEGIPVYRDHEYALVSAYDNTGGPESDAMAVMILGIEDKDFDPSVLRDNGAHEAKLEEVAEVELARLRHHLVTDPNNAVTNYRIAGLLTRRGRYDEALGHMQRALELDPTSVLYPKVVIHLKELMGQRPPGSL